MHRATLLVGVLVLLCGCANRPDSIRASFVSHERFISEDCDSLSLKISASKRELDRVSRMQESKANSDAVGVFLIGIPFSKLSGDHEGEIARLKGEVEAVETAQLKSKCFSSAAREASPVAPSTVQSRLEELKRMYNGGLITFDEYEGKRKKIVEEL